MASTEEKVEKLPAHTRGLFPLIIRNKKGIEEQALDALTELTKVLAQLREGQKLLEKKFSELENVVKHNRMEDIIELKADLKHKSEYLEQMFENLMEKDFSKSPYAKARDRANQSRESMYRNGKIAGPAGKLP